MNHEIINMAENWLKKPVITNIHDALAIADNLLLDLQKEIQQAGESRKLVGILIGKIKSTQKSLHSIELRNWVKIGNGALAIGNRPSIKLMADLALQNTTHILTLLSEHEGGKTIGELTRKSGMGWLWLPMESASPPSEERYEEIAKIFQEMENLLNNHGNIYIHCSAGIHRTGMISFAFLRFLGFDIETAKLKLGELRDITSEGVGENRLEWGNQVLDILKGYCQ